MEIAGYIASVLIGVSLGLIGGGGSMLTVPVLVYLFGINAELAVTQSLLVVGGTSLIGSVSYFRNGLVNIKAALVFGIPSVLAVFITRSYILPLIPEHLLQVNGFDLTRRLSLLLFFALLMIAASYRMIKTKTAEPQRNSAGSPVVLLLQGLAIGFITGLIGAGGGFLIIPALVNMQRLPMKTAIGTSLFIITVNSLVGFLFSLKHQTIDWPFLLTIVALATAGIIAGSFWAAKIDGQKLKIASGWFLLAMGMYIIIKELLLH